MRPRVWQGCRVPGEEVVWFVAYRRAVTAMRMARLGKRGGSPFRVFPRWCGECRAWHVRRFTPRDGA